MSENNIQDEDCISFYNNEYYESKKTQKEIYNWFDFIFFCTNCLDNLCSNQEWLNYKGSCIKFSDFETSWIDAKLECEQYNSQLLVLNKTNHDIQNFISKIGIKFKLSMFLILDKFINNFCCNFSTKLTSKSRIIFIFGTFS